MIRLVALGIKGSSSTEDDWVEEELTERELEILAERNATEERVLILRKQTEDVKSVIYTFTEELSRVYTNESALLASLKKELQEVCSQQIGQPQQEDAELPTDPMFHDAIERTRAHNASLKEKKSEKKSDSIKRLFKLIAAKAHPDKTNSSPLLELFKLAREAYDENDYLKLQKIFKCIVSRTTWAFLRLEEELNNLKEQEVLTTQEIQAAVGSPMFQAMRDYRTGLPHLTMRASNFFRQDLQSQIDQMQKRIHLIDPTRYPEPEQTEITLSSIFSSSIFRGF